MIMNVAFKVRKKPGEIEREKKSLYRSWTHSFKGNAREKMTKNGIGEAAPWLLAGHQRRDVIKIINQNVSG